MKNIKKIISQVKKRFEKTTIEEPFVTLIQVAQESPDIRNLLLAILQEDEFHRTSMINTLLEEMRYKGAPDALIIVIASLLDHRVAQKASELLLDNRST